tara:strand:+ start:492 stop:869 length:378 start_codon:yes stop_codon:yes gene_type:complete
MEPRKLVTLEQIYEHFDVPHIRRLIAYSDKKNPINMDNVIIHAPILESVAQELGEGDLNMINDPVDYEAKVLMLENQLRIERERFTNGGTVQAVTDDSNETVEIPKHLLKQLMNVLNNNKDQNKF